MKKMILALLTLTIAGANVQTASAAGGGWSTAGKVLAGVTAGVVIGQAIAPRPVYYAAPAQVYYAAPGFGYAYSYPAPAQPVVIYAVPAPTVYAAPAPVVVYRPRVYVAPPLVSVSFGYCGGCGPHYYRHGSW